jgi:hypothetical protein
MWLTERTREGIGNMETLKHELLRLALADVTGREVRKVYGRAIDRFCLWLSEQGARNYKMKDLCNEHKMALVKEYISFLTNMGVPRFCIITYLKPVCKAFQIVVDEPADSPGGLL